MPRPASQCLSAREVPPLIPPPVWYGVSRHASMHLVARTPYAGTICPSHAVGRMRVGEHRTALHTLVSHGAVPMLTGHNCLGAVLHPARSRAAQRGKRTRSRTGSGSYRVALWQITMPDFILADVRAPLARPNHTVARQSEARWRCLPEVRRSAGWLHCGFPSALR